MARKKRQFVAKVPAQYHSVKVAQPEYVTERHLDHDYICSTCRKHIKGTALIFSEGYWRHANCRQSHNPQPVVEMRTWQGYCIVEGCSRQAFIHGTECMLHM